MKSLRQLFVATNTQEKVADNNSISLCKKYDRSEAKHEQIFG